MLKLSSFLNIVQALFCLLLSSVVNSYETSLEGIHAFVCQAFVGEILPVQDTTPFTRLYERWHGKATWNVPSYIVFKCIRRPSTGKYRQWNQKNWYHVERLNFIHLCMYITLSVWRNQDHTVRGFYFYTHKSRRHIPHASRNWQP